jgi:hypothetical protein
VRQELAAEIAAAEEERGLIDAIDEFVLEQRAASQEAKRISIEHCFATQSDTKHCVMDPNDPAGQIQQNAIDAQQKIGDAVLPGLKARPPAPKVLPPAKGTVRVAKDAKSHAPRYKKEAMKLAETKKTADALSKRGYNVLIRKGDEGLPDLRVKKIGEAGDLIPAESKRLVSGSQTALRNAIKEGTRSGQGLTIIDATGVPLGEANIRRAIKGFLDTSVPARVASGSAGAHGKVVVLYGRYQSIEFSF